MQSYSDITNVTNISAFTLSGLVYGAMIDFGSTPVDDKVFTITDANVTPTSKLVGNMYYNSALITKSGDDYSMDPIGVVLVPGSGTITVYAYGIKGLVSGQYSIYYMIG